MFRMTSSPLCSLLVVLLAVTAAGCKRDTTFDPTPVVIPDPTTVVVEGSIMPNGAFTHPFLTFSFGTVQATLVALEPDPEAIVGLALGTWNGASCQVIIADDRATQGVVVTGRVASAGSLCVRVYDANGGLPGAVSFSIQLVHP
ncbi:MAG: hypothetical protein Q8L86_17390 [Vicinamibacterales bacterium]|nr:hypothetical protein [Vicinamibacterales bacterium]